MDFENTLNITGVLTAVDLFIGCFVLTLTIFNLFIIRTGILHVKAMMKTLDRMEKKIIAIKDNQATLLNKTNNTSEANGNAVNIYKNHKNPETYDGQLVSALLRGIVDKIHHLGEQVPGNNHHPNQPPKT
jgi:uncharacterized protein YoxC